MGNCLFFAFRMLFKHGGNVVIRKSKYGGGSHIMWTMDFLDFHHYVPLNPPLKFPILSKILFRGKIKTDKLDTLYEPRK